MKPDPTKIQALQDLPTSDNHKQLQSFLGLINYLQPFLPDLASKTTFLRKQISSWDWNPSTDIAFQKLKQWICKMLLNTTLAYFDCTKPVVIQTDASEYGLGAALLQDGRPIAFASKTLTDVETRYANIERECLSVCFGLEKFHTYVYGHHITVQNDHKPLEMIQKKPIHAAPPHLQHMLLCLQKYDYTIVYRPGKEMVLADRLSRFPSRKEHMPIELHQNIHSIQLEPDRLNIVRGAIERDPIHSTVYRLTLNGWPDRVHEVPRIARQFWGTCDELTIENGILLKGDRVCIPPELYDRMLSDLHGNHRGIEKMRHLSQHTVYWPGLDADITDYVNHCKTCTQHKAKQAVQPMLPRDVPDSPWQELAADFFTHNHKEYLLIADTFSKYPFVYQLSSKTAESINKKLQNLISQYGPPKRLYSDIGPPFSSKAFQKFLTSQYIDHITSSPLYPKSNGFIERQIKTIKTALATASSSGKSLDYLLLSLRSTPIGRHLPSPREILHNRTEDCPGQPPRPVDFEEVRNYLIAQKSTQKRHYDKRHNVRDLPDLYPGQAVLFLSPADTNIYIEGTITGPSTTPHSYNIEAQGRTYRCNREHIHPLNIDKPTISRPSAHQEIPISGPSPPQSPISSPPGNNSCQTSSARPSKPSHIPTLRHSASPSRNPATNHQVKTSHKPLSRIPTSANKFISRPSGYLSKPIFKNKCNTSLARPSNRGHNNSNFARPSNTTLNNIPIISRPSYSTDEVINIITQLISINGYKETKTLQTLKLHQIQAQTHQHRLCQVNPANPVKIQVNRKIPLVSAQMTQKQIQMQQVMTRNPLQIRPP